MNSELTLWEYRYVYMKTNTDSGEIEYMLNEMGSTGLELVNGSQEPVEHPVKPRYMVTYSRDQ